MAESHEMELVLEEELVLEDVADEEFVAEGVVTAVDPARADHATRDALRVTGKSFAVIGVLVAVFAVAVAIRMALLAVACGVTCVFMLDLPFSRGWSGAWGHPFATLLVAEVWGVTARLPDRKRTPWVSRHSVANNKASSNRGW